jgi:hypothetical protein
MPKSRIEFVAEKALVGTGAFWYGTPNTRAVPLARKGDANQGRVFYFLATKFRDASSLRKLFALRWCLT